MRAIIPGAASGSSAVLPEERLAGGDGEEVRAEPVDLGEQAGPRRCREAEHGDDRRDADRDPERREPGADAAGAQPDAGDAGEVAGPQLQGRQRRGSAHRARAAGWLTRANAAEWPATLARTT